MRSAMSSSMNGQAQSLISLLSAKSRAQPLVNSSFRSYAGLATKSDSLGKAMCPMRKLWAPGRNSQDFLQLLGYSRIHKLAGYLFHYSTNPKINVCLPALCSRRLVHSSAPKDLDQGMDYRSMNFVRGVIEEDRRGGIMNNFQFPHHNVEQDVDFVHIKLMRNNTFVTVTDSKGNKKIGASSGCLSEMKGGPKASRYAAEATAEHVGRMSRNIGRKSIVMRVKGFTFFKKKRQAIMSWREGFTNSKVEQNRNSPVVYIEDATRRPHNGCRLPRKRRV